MTMKMRKERCKYPDCNKVRRSPDGYCDTCVNPVNRYHCECGAEIGRRSKRCRPCSTAINASSLSVAKSGTTMPRAAEPFCKPITADGLAMLRQGRVSWSALKDNAKPARIQMAKDLVTLGLLTEDQSREEYPAAWAVIDRRTVANCMEVE